MRYPIKSFGSMLGAPDSWTIPYEIGGVHESLVSIGMSSCDTDMSIYIVAGNK